MGEKYNKIYLLVHPLYDLIIMRGFLRQVINDTRENPIIKQIKLGDKRTNDILKKTLGIYGKQINKISENKDAILIVFEPKLRGYENYSNKMTLETYKMNAQRFNETLKEQKELLSKFNLFIKDKLSERVIFSNYDPNQGIEPGAITTPNFMNKIFLNKLNKEISISAFGEYRGLCVSTWGKAIKNRLEYFGIKSKINYLNNLSLSEKPFELNKFRKAILPKHRKREVQHKNKIMKLKLNQTIKRQLAHM
ncbi:MAG: hypothetical protein WCF78_03225 [archaeon]